MSDLPNRLLPAQEQARLQALARYRVLDTVAERAYDDIVKIAAAVAQTPVAIIGLIDHDRQWYKARVGVAADSVPRRESFCNRLIDYPQEVLVIADTHLDPIVAQHPQVVGLPHIRFYMGAPLLTADGHMLGSLCVIDDQPRQPHPDQIDALAALARQIIHLLELRQRNHDVLELLAERSVQMQELSQQQRTLQVHNQHLQTASLTDGLTGLFNRAAFDQQVTSLFVQAQRQATALSLMLIDADHFKAYNDQFGHVAGDEALRQLGKILQQTSRKTDIAARYGGEEFVLILPETSAKAAQQIAERLCAQVADTVFEHRAMTVSVGVATWPDVGEQASITALIESADQALYRAKRQGRNQVAMAQGVQNL